MPDSNQQLRPVERTVQRLLADGHSHTEIAWRLRRSPGFVHRVEAFSAIERTTPPPSSGEHLGAGNVAAALRPIESRVLNMLEVGCGYAEIASKLRRTPNYVARVERFAQLRLANPSA